MALGRPPPHASLRDSAPTTTIATAPTSLYGVAWALLVGGMEGGARAVDVTTEPSDDPPASHARTGWRGEAERWGRVDREIAHAHGEERC